MKVKVRDRTWAVGEVGRHFEQTLGIDDRGLPFRVYPIRLT